MVAAAPSSRSLVPSSRPPRLARSSRRSPALAPPAVASLRRRSAPLAVAALAPGSSALSEGSPGRAVVGVPASPAQPPRLPVSTPGLVAGAVFGGLPFLAWVARRANGESNEAQASGRGMPDRGAIPAGAAPGDPGIATRPSPRSSPPFPSIGERLPSPLFDRCAYLDYNATTPIFPEVAAAMDPFVWEHFGNPSSGHAFARPCAEALAAARASVAAAVECEPSEVIFTSCGSESDNHAIASAVKHYRASGAVTTRSQRSVNEPPTTIALKPHVVASAVEHPAVLEYLVAAEAAGELTHTLIGVDGEGRVDPADVEAAIRPETCLLTLMHANNEVGAVQPVAECARRARDANPRVLVHCDAAQSLGKIPVTLRELGEPDYVTIVGHKIGAPKGVAALVVRDSAPFSKLLHGGGQERGRRAGTENVTHCVALGAACAIVAAEREETATHMALMVDRLREILIEGLGADAVRVNGPAAASLRLPNTLSVGLRGVSASALLESVAEEVAASAGAACHSGDAAAQISGVLLAMDVPEEFAVGTLRLSVGRHTTREDVERGGARIVAAAKRQMAEIEALPEGERPWWCVRNAAEAFR